MRIISITSPINGTISDIGDDTITIYVDIKDDHTLYAPMNGVLDKIKDEQGSWTRNVFHAEVNKIARTTLYVKNQYLDEPVSFWIEVGKPKYVTDRVRINKKVNDSLVQGEKIGEILLGSLVEVHLPKIPKYLNIKKGDKVTGSKTVLVDLLTSKNNNNLTRLLDAIRVSPHEKILEAIKEVNIKQLIVLTTPHELCIPEEEARTCDLYSKKLAENISESLKDNSRKVIIVHGDINRTYIDLNRYTSRYLTEFRSRIRDIVNKQIDIVRNQDITNQNKIIYVLDCHSFPKGSYFRNIRTTNPEVVLLFDNTNDFIYAYELVELLKDAGIQVIILPGIKNDIIDEFTGEHNGVRIVSVLVEVNESISEQRLKDITKVFNEWINRVNKYIIDKTRDS